MAQTKAEVEYVKGLAKRNFDKSIDDVITFLQELKEDKNDYSFAQLMSMTDEIDNLHAELEDRFL